MVSVFRPFEFQDMDTRLHCVFYDLGWPSQLLSQGVPEGGLKELGLRIWIPSHHF